MVQSDLHLLVWLQYVIDVLFVSQESIDLPVHQHHGHPETVPDDECKHDAQSS